MRTNKEQIDLKRLTTTTRISAVFIIGLMLSIKGDGRFPLPSSIDETILQIILTSFAALLLIVLLWLAFPNFRINGSRLISKIPADKLAPVFGLIFLGMSSVVIYLSSNNYKKFGYHAEPKILTGIFIIFAFFFIMYVRFAIKRGNAGFFLFLCGSAHVVLIGFSIANFPLHPLRSDMLPVIQSAINRLFQGEFPYTSFESLNNVPLTYLPGLWTAYIPGWLIGVDPRWTHMAASIIAVFLVYKSRSNELDLYGSYLLGLFILQPYLIYRHEIYIGPILLAAALIFYFLRKKRPYGLSASWGWSLTVSQFFWILSPVLLLFLWKRHAKPRLVKMLILAGIVFLAIMAPFLIIDPNAFFYCTLLRWSHVTAFSGYNIAYWLEPLLGGKGLMVLQGLYVALMAVLFLRVKPKLSNCFYFMGFTLFGFVILNRIVWVYFFPIVTFLILLGVFAGEEDFPDAGARR